MTTPNERLSSKQVAEEHNINHSTLRGWRRMRTFDKRYPRYHKLFTGKIFYVRREIEEDLARMEVEAGKMEMVI
jgi:transposase-like protein